MQSSRGCQLDLLEPRFRKFSLQKCCQGSSLCTVWATKFLPAMYNGSIFTVLTDLGFKNDQRLVPLSLQQTVTKQSFQRLFTSTDNNSTSNLPSLFQLKKRRSIHTHTFRKHITAEEFYPRLKTEKELKTLIQLTKKDESRTSLVIVRHPFYRLVSAFR